MMYSELNQAQNEILDVIRAELQRGCAPDGFPASLPMWRTTDGVEADSDRQETVALRAAMARLRATDRPGHDLVARLAAGHAVAADEWPAAGVALTDLDAWVEEALGG